MLDTENYVYKKEVDWSVLMEGFTLPIKIINVNNPIEKRKKDAYQIRYTRNGDFSKALQFRFSRSMNYIKNVREKRDANQMIVCPNHHSIIHDANPFFDRKKWLFRFDNGIEERLVLNKHLV